MRNIFLALVLANLAFAAWRNWFAVSDEFVRPASDLPTITLASEVADSSLEAPAAGAPAPASDAAGVSTGSEDAADLADEAQRLAADEADESAADPTAAVPAEEMHCVSVGPFRELSQATSASAALRGGGYAPTQRAGDGDIWVGYWVYIERIPTQERANAILEELRQNGVTDSYVIPDSDSGNLISLGVFTEIGRAGGRREEARRLGYEPVIADRTRRGTVYWVDVMLDADESLDFDALQAPGRILRLEQRPCERAPA